MVGTTAYSGNTTDLTGDTQTFAIDIGPNEPLFVNAAAGNFYPAEGSRIIDSSLDSLQDRANMVEVRDPLGIPPSPILAPDYDGLGQLRMDDPSVSPPTAWEQPSIRIAGRSTASTSTARPPRWSIRWTTTPPASIAIRRPTT